MQGFLSRFSFVLVQSISIALGTFLKSVDNYKNGLMQMGGGRVDGGAQVTWMVYCMAWSVGYMDGWLFSIFIFIRHKVANFVNNKT